jgi:Tfp pilus assembly protein PilN
VKRRSFLNTPEIYIEIGLDSLRAWNGEAGIEIPLERTEQGRLTGPCREKVERSLKDYLKLKSWQGRPRAFCAIGASGVSLRALSLPPSTGTELQRLLVLQIESEFPLPPDELAWGYMRTGDGGAPRQEILVAAVRKETLAEYEDVLNRAGVAPVFTLAAMVRNALCAEPAGTHVIFDLGRQRSEIATFEKGCARQLWILPAGTEATRNDASLDAMAARVGAVCGSNRLYVTGEPGFRSDLPAQLAMRLTGVTCARLEEPSGTGRSAAILGMKKLVEETGGVPLVLRTRPQQANGAIQWSQGSIRKWAAAAVALLCAWLLLPYAEAIVLKPFLEHRLAAIKSGQGRLAAIDKDLDFLEYLQQNHPPYLDALYLFAKAAPQGTKFDSISMNRSGEISLRGSMQNYQQVADFRSKLIESAFFSTVAVEDQTPSQDRQKVTVRITAQWVPAAARAALSIGPSAEEIDKVKAAATNAPATGAPPGLMPPGFPPGMTAASHAGNNSHSTPGS